MSEKAIKNLKVKFIDIQDFKNIESINAEFSDWNVIGGYNGQGKSSFIEAILTAVQGQKFYGQGAVTPASLVKSGENKAIIKLIIKGKENEISLERVFKKGTAKKPAGTTDLIATMDGEKIAQKSLDALLNNLTLDPMNLAKMTVTDQIKEIKNTIGIDTEEIDKKIKDCEEDTKESRAYAKKTETIYQDLIASGVPSKVEKKSVSGLIEKRDKVAKKDAKLKEMSDKKQEILDLEEKLKKAKADLEIIKDEGGKLFAETKGFGTVEEIDAEIKSIETENDSNDKYDRYVSAKKQRDEARDQFETDEDTLKNLRSERTEIIAKSNIPKYMEISDELGILVDGIEYKLLNTAKKIEVAIDLVLISGSPLRMIRIEQGGELDVKTLAGIRDKIIEHDFQIFIERPVIDKYDSIIISEGEKIEDTKDFISKNQ